MSERPMRVLTGLTGLLIVAGVNDLAGERGVAAIGSAYAQPLGAQEEEYEGEESAGDGGFFEESGEAPTEDAGEAFAGDESEGGADTSAPEEEEEESSSTQDTAAAESPAEGEAAPAEPAADPATQAATTDQPAPPAALSKEERAFQVIIQHTRQILPELEGHAFQRSDSLTELGANSLDRSEIFAMTLETLGLSRTRGRPIGLVRTENIGQLASLIASEMP